MGHLTFLLAAVGSLLPFPSAATPLDKRAAVDTCLSKLKVPVLTAGSADYVQALKPFNNRVTFKPAAYAVPKTVEDVQNAVSCGSQNDVKVTAKSGGHSYGSHGLGGEDGHLIVDMRNFNSVTVDQAAQTAVIGTAGRLGNVATALYNQGKQAISHGTCPGVGVGGLSLHGGYGLISRSKGLTLDNILEAQVVLANSSVVTASPTQNPDLFWALRGAGAAFGIVTNFKFKTFNAPESNLVFQYSLSPSSASQLSTIITALQDFTRNSQPPELNMRLFLSAFTTFSGVYYGTRANFDKVMQPLLTKMGIGSGGFAQITEKNTWLNTLTSFSNGPLEQPAVYDTHETFYAKSLMPEYLSPAAIDALSKYWEKNARNLNRAWYLLIDSHGGANSAVSSVAGDATSYAHRNATFKMQFYDRVYNGNYDPSWQSFLNGWIGNITAASPGVQYGMYINYADTGLSKEEAHKAYWLKNYDRLVQVKNVYDPKKLFTGPQLVGS
ncbi:FAD-binding domain-containing protein [Westerdykella ornata]|uniref:FAD-binding domain-containing protein n=1 Tax=Westerdykella ornata TaxID=318751 RepID=A0A6A6JYI5_WESOR|nr:FAD-binding domain-containing protein [Westerdykella ornata]KAF2280099.1 FAD-binding domain-containing protein [Westerdykella ornata]